MRSPIHIRLQAGANLPPLDLPPIKQHELNAKETLRLLSALGGLLSALPDEGGEDWFEISADAAFHQLTQALVGVGLLQTALAEFAWSEVHELATAKS